MKTTLHTDWTVCDVGNGFVSDRDDDNGLLGLDGQLIIQPKHQYNYIYGDGKRDVMSNTLRKPLGLAQGSRQAEISNISDIIVHESHPVPNVGNALPSSRLRVPHSVIAR
jgi:hypothetical protein